MRALEGKYTWVVAGLFGLLVAILIPSQITDATHEVIFVGTSWFDAELIPLVQSYSHYGPLSLYIASWWHKLVGDGMMNVVLDGAIGASLGLLVWSVARSLQANPLLRLCFVGLTIACAVGSGAIERGPSPLKIGLLLTLFTILFYQMYVRSEPSFWLLGKTDRNWRLMLVSALCFGLLMYIEILYALPLGVYGMYILAKNSQSISKFAQQLAWYIVMLVAHSWIWISYFASRGLLGTWTESLRVHVGVLLSGELGRFSIAIFIPTVIVFCFAVYHARRENFAQSKVLWLMAVSLIVISVAIPRVVFIASPLLVLLCIIWADRKSVELIGDKTVLYGGAASAVLCLCLIVGYRSAVQLENSHSKLARSHIEQRLVDESHVLYYGQGAGFYSEGVTPATSFVDARVFAHDTATLGLVDRLRGESEASLPRFVVVPHGRLQVADNERINTYIDKHYEKSASLDGGFEIYRRR